MTAPTRTLLIVAGPGRSGTSVVTGLLGRIGYSIPQPEIAANVTNPRGFGEPKWVLDFHNQLLGKAKIAHGDSRPSAAAAAVKAAERPEVHDRLITWLETQFEISDAVVVKDPRLLWFTELWSATASELGARTVALTMLRHPVPVTKSAQTHYMDLPPSTRVASWVNGALVTEHNTRTMPRTSVEYDALLQDWKAVLDAALQPVGVPSVSSATPEQVAAGDVLVDPTLRRSVSTWEELHIPEHLRDLAERVYSAVCVGSRADADVAATSETMDALAAEYGELYAHAEAIAHSTLSAGRRAARQRGYREGVKDTKAKHEEAAAKAAATQSGARTGSTTPRRLLSRAAARLRAAQQRHTN